jgi:hypothetical protein
MRGMAICRVVQTGYAALIAVAASLLLPFLSVALYSGPMTDDFCISSLSLRTSLVTVWNYYLYVGGRLPALMIIAIPSVFVRVTGLDLYAVYPIVVILMILGFMAAMVAASALLLRTENRWISTLFGLLLAAFTFSLLPSPGEFIYWVTGAACYLTASAGAIMFAAWCTKQTLDRDHITGPTVVAVAALCFITAMFNEFTVFFLLGVAFLALLVRLFFMGEKAQISAHLAIISASLVGYGVVIFSPGNVIRLSQFSRSGNISASLQNASTYTIEYATALARFPVVSSFAVLIIFFAIATACPLRPRHALQYVVFAVGLLIVAALWAYTAYFIGAYGTGDVLTLRARDEVVAVVFVVSAILIVLPVHAFAGLMLNLVGARVPRLLCFLMIATGAWYSQPIRQSQNYKTMKAEWSDLAIFWRESIARDAILSSAASADIVVPRRTVAPSLLTGDELKETPSQLPNDCIARYYGKKSVVLAPAN